MWTKVGGVWKKGRPWIKVSGVWKKASAVWTKVGGVWKRMGFFGVKFVAPQNLGIYRQSTTDFYMPYPLPTIPGLDDPAIDGGILLSGARTTSTAQCDVDLVFTSAQKASAYMTENGLAIGDSIPFTIGGTVGNNVVVPKTTILMNIQSSYDVFLRPFPGQPSERFTIIKLRARSRWGYPVDKIIYPIWDAVRRVTSISMNKGFLIEGGN